jgi:hypothetical protein
VKPSRPQIEIAARAWLDTARRVWATDYPNRSNPFGTLEEMAPEGRTFMFKTIGAAIAAADPDNVERVLAARQEDTTA